MFHWFFPRSFMTILIAAACCILALREVATADDQFGQLLNKFHRANVAEDYHAAERAARAALAVANTPYQTAAATECVARALDDQGDLERADQVYRQSLQRFLKLGSANQLDVAVLRLLLAKVRVKQGRPSIAAKEANRAITLANDIVEGADEGLVHKVRFAELLVELAFCARCAEEFGLAEELIQSALNVFETRRDERTIVCYAELAAIHDDKGDPQEAERILERLKSVVVMMFEAFPPFLAISLEKSAQHHEKWGHLTEAMLLRRRILELRDEKVSGSEYHRIGNLKSLAKLYYRASRFADAEDVLRRAIAICKREGEAKNHASVELYSHLGRIHHEQGRYLEAEAAFLKVLEIYDSSQQYTAASRVFVMSDLARTYRRLGKHREAVQLYHDAIKRLEGVAGDLDLESQPLRLLIALYKDYLLAALLGLDLLETTNSVAASSDQATDALNSFHYYVLAHGAWKAKERKEALRLLDEAIAHAEKRRSLHFVSDLRRSQVFGSYYGLFETLLTWELESPRMSKIFDALERSRARSLLDQMTAQGADVLSGSDDRRIGDLRQKRNHLLSRITSLQHGVLSLDYDRRGEGEIEKFRQDLFTELKLAQDDFLALEEGIIQLSPAVALTSHERTGPVDLNTIQCWLRAHNALLLEFFVGTSRSFLFALPPAGDPIFEQLHVPPALAHDAGFPDVSRLEPEPVTNGWLANRLFSTVGMFEGSGLLDHLHDSSRTIEARTVEELSAMWDLLIPDSLAERILNDEFSRLIIVPDGCLAQMPFEILVVQRKPSTVFLLEAGPPIHYAPSATVLHNLARRASQRDSTHRQPVLTIGDPDYTKEYAATAPDTALTTRDLTPLGTYRSAGGSFARLTHSGRESQWVRDVFSKHGHDVIQLVRASATEASLRQRVPGQGIVHLACHGLAFEEHGNVFGFLAVAPGNMAVPNDDGLVTLAEIYEFDLDGCELVILSACQTNVGAEQRGEGIQSLARGFLAAGAQRVVATNWIVDDEAAASLVSVFCSIIARDLKDKGNTDYAAALQKAKQWVRKHPDHPEWKHPYYWAPFVLIGPH